LITIPSPDAQAGSRGQTLANRAYTDWKSEARMESPDSILQAIFDQAAVGIAQISLDGSWLRVNDRYCQMLGYSEAELRTKTVWDITHPDDCYETIASLRQLLEGAISSHSMERRYIRKDGTISWGRLNRSLVRDHEDQPKYFIAVVEDITEKIQAERALQERERQLVLAQTAGRLGLWERDLNTGLTFTSSEFARLHGLTADQLPATHERYLPYVHPDDLERVQAEYRESIERTHVWDTEFRVLWPDGSVHWLLGQGQVLLDTSGKPVRLAGIALDITERKQAEAKLRESEELFRNMADTAPVMIWVIGSDKRATFLNKCGLNFTGKTMEQELGDGWVAGVHPDDREQLLALFSSSIDARQPFSAVFRLRRADGEYRWVLSSGVPRFAPDDRLAGYIGTCVDITELKRTQEEALARQKLESLGVLANGIAHDFNNLLGSIMAQAELVKADLVAGLSPDGAIEGIKTVAIHGAEIVRELMTYVGHDQDGFFEPVDLSRLTAEMLELLKLSISKHARLKINLEKNLPAVLGNAPQIRQVLMNLIINSSEAIGDREGVIQVTISGVTGGPGSVLNNAGNVPAVDYVRLEVSDSGCGLTEEIRVRIFDPFFTTKFAGRGLGLAVVQGIVRAHGGVIDVVSAPGQGATFQVLLPTTPNRALEAQNAVAYSGAVRSHALTQSGATVLVVEDEEVLRRAVSKALRIKGFAVIEAKDGDFAIELMRTHRDDIDVILLDITLPGASSKEVFEEAQRIWANPKVVLTSAYDRRTIDSLFPGLRITQFIRKPFQLDDLAGTLRHALASPITFHSGAAQ
jgi:two-component system, cell cycle sensor histidine kinase and response regulator CckA